MLLAHFPDNEQAKRSKVTCPSLLLLVNRRTSSQTLVSRTSKPKFFTTLQGDLCSSMNVHPPRLGNLITTLVLEGLGYCNHLTDHSFTNTHGCLPQPSTLPVMDEQDTKSSGPHRAYFLGGNRLSASHCMNK